MDAKSKPMSIKLVIHKKQARIMYAEAGKEFVDVLLSFLILPAAAIVKQVLRTDKMHLCITNLYSSVENMPESLIKTGKAALLQPKVVSTYTNKILNLEPPKYFGCARDSCSYRIISSDHNTKCSCGNGIYREVAFVDGISQSITKKGFVEPTASFAITDDLTITPLNSTTAIVQLWSKFEVKELAEVEERNVTVGATEVTGLLKAAMVSSTALNEVFKAYISCEQGVGPSAQIA